MAAGAGFNVPLSMNSHKITDVTDPASAQDAATKKYVDDGLAAGTAPTGSAGGDLAGTYPNPTVAKIHETGGPTALTIGTITDGEYLKRSGSTLVSGAGGTTDIAATIHAATSKATPVDNDELGLVDSAASNVLKKLLWSNVKATLKTYFDTLYSAAGTPAGSIEYDYVERTTTLTVTATSDATATSFIDGNAVSYDGSTRVKIEVWAWVGIIDSTNDVIMNLYDGSTDLGRFAAVQTPTVTNGGVASVLYGVRFLTPSNASHTYSIRAWKTGGTATVNAGAGGTATTLPAWYRITKA